MDRQRKSVALSRHSSLPPGTKGGSPESTEPKREEAGEEEVFLCGSPSNNPFLVTKFSYQPYRYKIRQRRKVRHAGAPQHTVRLWQHHARRDAGDSSADSAVSVAPSAVLVIRLALERGHVVIGGLGPRRRAVRVGLSALVLLGP